MPERSGPSVRGRQLARELRRLREAAQLTGEAAAAHLDWSSAKVSRIETARTPVTISDLHKLLDLYGATDIDVGRLEDLARAARQRGWWDTYEGDLPLEYTTYIGLEAEAASLSSYDVLVLHGLLQTEEYARAVLKSLLLISPGEVERGVRVRLLRQKRLNPTNEIPLTLQVVLDEDVLRRQIGGAEVMRHQLQHLEKVAGLPNVKLQVLPYSVGAHPATAGPFTIFRFPRSSEPEIASLELLAGHLFIEGEKDVYRYALVFSDLTTKALNPDESRAFIRQVVNDL